MEFKEWLRSDEGRFVGAAKGLLGGVVGGVVDAATQMANIPSPRDIGVSGVEPAVSLAASGVKNALNQVGNNIRMNVAPTPQELDGLKRACQKNDVNSCKTACQFDQESCNKLKDLARMGLYVPRTSRALSGRARMQAAWLKAGGR